MSILDVLPQLKDLMAKTNAVEAAVIDGDDLSPLEQGMFQVDLNDPQSIECYTFLIKNLESRFGFYQSQADENQVIASKIKGLVGRYKKFMQGVMIDSNTKEVFGKSLRYQLQTPKTTKLVIDDESKLGDYLKEQIKLVLDNAAIKSDLENGVALEGAHLEQTVKLATYPIKGL